MQHQGGNVLGLPHCIRHHHDEHAREGITVQCPSCGHEQFVPATEDQILRYRNTHIYIQDAFPQLTADQREAVQTGICKTCWDKIT